jgi:C1A family cysteine protease
MNNRFIVSALSIALTILSTSSYALELGKPITTFVAVNNAPVQALSSGHIATSQPTKKEIKLMNIKLTPKEKQAVIGFKPRRIIGRITNNENMLPAAINLGMNDVPVLDQGQHGSCATFANTAAIDAVLGKGDYISQLCQLELGSYLEKNGYYPSGWEGSMGPWVLDQMMRFGIINKDNQQTKSCAQIKEYPLKDGGNNGSPMTVIEFNQMSETLANAVHPVSLFDVAQRFDDTYSETTAEKLLIEVKTSLTQGHRLTFGTALVLTSSCDAGACANYHVPQDTWALTKEIYMGFLTPNLAGHEMVIIGYDDNAVATDKYGNKHQGLLTLRNSWSSATGDQGNFYMTYDYFEVFVLEVQKIFAYSGDAKLQT